MTNRITIIIVVTLALVALLCFIQQLINLKRLKRARQAALPVAALIYCIIAVMLSMRYSDRLDELLERLGIFVPYGAVVLNCMAAAGFLVLKSILLQIVRLIWRIRTLIEFTSGGFYEYDETYSEWFLKQKWANVRSLFLSSVICIGIICAAFVSLLLIFGPDSQLWIFAFPVAALIVTGEIFSFLNGQTRVEFISKVLGEDSDSRRVSNFYRIREIYEKMFPGQLLAAHTGCEFVGRNSAVELLKDLSEGDRYDRMTVEYFALIDDIFKPDLDGVMATNKLMHGKSVVFLDPFYRDAGRYIVPSITKTLLSGKKCLVIAGRNSTYGDIVKWLRDELAGFNAVSSLWRIHELTVYEPDCDIGVISSRHMYDMNILKANSAFFSETDFTFIVEPSLIINIGQIGFNIIVDEIHKNISEPVFCICDRNADGLVDTMSHLLRTEITDVIAAPVPRCVYSSMAWNADGDYLRQQLFDKQTRYLGNGAELAAVAIKNQIPKVTWYSETKSPVRDISWIAGQYHTTICRYMNIPSQQSNLYDKLWFESNIWNVPSEGESFTIVEDEFCNMFNTLRAYMSRGSEQAFVNVLSENYLLRDYMRCNSQLFRTDPGAVPSFVPDYAKTLRNTVIKLILHMTVRPVGEKEIIDELYLAGYKADDALSSLTRLVRRYTTADESLFTVGSLTNGDNDLFADIENCFSIDPDKFENCLAESLKSAFYIIEDEKSESSYLDAKLFGHVTQTILPGQYITYDGKYYYAKIVTPERGVVLRRASDLYDTRKYYRQIRAYSIDENSTELMSVKKVMDIEIAYFCCSISIRTTGYLDMCDNNDLRTARIVDFAADPGVSEYNRQYRNKTIMRIHFPESDDKIRFTICMLMMEVFRSLFPHSWHYLAAVTVRPDDISGMLNYVTYEISGEIEDEYVYIIEDSDVDLGLLDAVEKNLVQIMEIIADFLDWHFEKMRETPYEDPLPPDVTMPADVKKRSLFSRMAGRISRIFGGREEEVKLEAPADDIKDDTQSPQAEVSGIDTTPVMIESLDGLETDTPAEFSIGDDEKEAEPGSGAPVPAEYSSGSSDYSFESEADADETSQPAYDANGSEKDTEGRQDERQPDSTKKYEEDLLEPEKDENVDIVHIDGTDIFDEDGDPYNDMWLEERFIDAGIIPITKSRYQKECYLKYGFEDIDARIRAEGLRNYLRLRGFTNSILTKSRLSSTAPKTLHDLDTENHCDFCGAPLTGISYERITDGRVRCRDCSTSAIVSLEEAREMFYRIRELMGCFFSIELNVPIGVRITNAQEVARGWGSVFRPSTEVAARVLGYARRKSGSFFLCMENGSPRLAFIDTMVHELTHIWQFVNWNDSEIESIYGSGSNRDIVYEGMAMWASVQYLYQTGETSYAQLQESLAETRADVYGIGFCLYRQKYPFIKDYSMQKFSPFTSFPPL